MTRVILQPAGDPHARIHYADTIASPVPQDRLGEYLTPADMAEIARIYGTRPVPTWGVTPGGRDVNRNKWERISPGDVVLMVRDGEVFVSGRVAYKTRNEPLAEALWRRNEDGATWEYLYFLDELTPQSLPNAEFNDLLGYRSGRTGSGLQRDRRIKEPATAHRSGARYRCRRGGCLTSPAGSRWEDHPDVDGSTKSDSGRELRAGTRKYRTVSGWSAYTDPNGSGLRWTVFVGMVRSRSASSQ